MKFKFFKWEGFYILAKNSNQAIKTWNSWAEDDNKIDESIILSPVNRLSTEAPGPCIVERIDWEDPIFILKSDQI